MPEAVLEPPARAATAAPADFDRRPLTAPAAAPIVDRGELIVRSAGAEIGRETFTLRRDGDRLVLDLVATATYPDRFEVHMAMRVDPATWRFDAYDAAIARDGASCVARARLVAGDVAVLEVEYPDGVRTVLDREPREHATHYLVNRPALTNTALCAIADAREHAVDSFSPWYVVRTTARTSSDVPTADGKRKLDRVRVDELLDLYCDGPHLAIMHYPQHAFVAARSEYDAAARRLAASDPTDNRWAGTLACPVR